MQQREECLRLTLAPTSVTGSWDKVRKHSLHLNTYLPLLKDIFLDLFLNRL